VLVDAHVETGNYADAVEACDRLLRLKPDLRSFARAAYLRELHGDLDGACQAMRLAADAGIHGQESRAWTLSNLASLYLQAGKPDTARFIYSGILEERPDYPFAMAGLARVCAGRGDYAGAIEWMKKAAAAMAEHEMLEELARLCAAAGKTREADSVAGLVLKEFELHEEGGWDIGHSYSLFCSDLGIRLDEALRRAERDLHERPGNIEALDAYAWALYRNGKPEEALPVITEAMRLGSKNAVIAFHAAVIYAKAGNPARARSILEKITPLLGFQNALYASFSTEISTMLRPKARQLLSQHGAGGELPTR
jgi:Flp pilus assembly protein TadD